jgi:very-short-patch-repair endonuclease
MIEQALHDRLVTLAELRAVAQRLGERGRGGSARYRAVVKARATWQPAAESGLEVRLLQALRHGGLPEPMRQFPITLPNGRNVRLDFAYPQWRIAIEVDGFGHTGPAAASRDQRRDHLLAEMGWITLRFPGGDLWPDASGAVAVVRLHVDAARRAESSNVERNVR